MKKLISSTAIAALVTLGFMAGAVAPASATDEPVEEPTTIVEETAPAEEPVTAPVSDETEPEAPAPQPEPAVPEEPAPVAEEPVAEEPYAPEATDPTVPDPIEQFRIMRWVLPNGGTPDNVTWPQPVFDAALIPCGESVWLQVDQYPYTTDEERVRTDALDDDGLLLHGEDHGWVVGWAFEQFTAEDCVVVPPAPEARIETRESTTENCESGLATTVTEGRESEPVYVEETNTWIDGEWSEWIQIASSVRPVTAEECPVVEPPVVEPPVEEPPALVPSAPEPVVEPAARAAVTADTLAETGGSGDLASFGGAVALLMLGGLLVSARRFVRR